jgi:hypothetical protein
MSETTSPNTTIAQYSIVSVIRQGGMGEVYRAHDTNQCDVTADGQRFLSQYCLGRKRVCAQHSGAELDGEA